MSNRGGNQRQTDWTGEVYSNNRNAGSSRDPNARRPPSKSFSTYASQNNPYNRPMPRVDVPGFQRATEDFDSTSQRILADRDAAYQQAQSTYDQQIAEYNAQLQQQQQATQSRITNPLTYTNPLFKTRVY